MASLTTSVEETLVHTRIADQGGKTAELQTNQAGTLLVHYASAQALADSEAGSSCRIPKERHVSADCHAGKHGTVIASILTQNRALSGIIRKVRCLTVNREV